MLFIQNSTVFGQAKAARITAYFNEYFKKNPDANVKPSQVLKLAKESRDEIVRLRQKL